ncbi:Pr6Pr family membrane protein [Aeromicrobium sp. CF4.19]|uniref:Pr6Pr family membrane protein n=1 Tax=Aeromicrobium sp. CF4.19 TaxID=3373082 RepID=UPI003EE4C8A8
MTPSPVSRWTHAGLAVLALAALLGQGVLVLRAGDSVVDFFSYFTIQSNLLVLAAAVVIASGRQPDTTWWRLLRLAGLVGITVTGIVYATLIGPNVSFEGAAWWYDKVFHYVVPIVAVIGHVAFRPRTTFRRADVVVLVWPIAWLAYTLVRARVGSPEFAAVGGPSRYPYDFLDVDAHGGAAAALGCLVVTAAMLLVAWLYVRLTPARA